MHGTGVFALAVDSRAASPRESTSFASLINASRWAWKPSLPVLSMTYISARVPTLLCAQPQADTFNCGAFDLILLFEAAPRFWRTMCGASLNDACGQNLCLHRREPARRRMRRCPAASDPPEVWRTEVCDVKGGGFYGGRCWIPTAESSAAAPLESAILGMQRACRERGEVHATARDGAASTILAVSNASFALHPTCWGKYIGLLHNEVQFFGGNGPDGIEIELPAAFLGVATIVVSGSSAATGMPAELLANVTALRACRARRLLSELRDAFGAGQGTADGSRHHDRAESSHEAHARLRDAEAWSFVIDASVPAPRRKTPYRFKSLAHSSRGGGSGRLSDFRAAWLPLASYYGLYTSDHWRHWHRIE